MQIFFLGASVPLTKTFSQAGKEAYPLVSNVTSFEETVNTPKDLYDAVVKHAAEGHCMLKGKLSRALTNESRRNTTNTDAPTQWVCLDFDRHECAAIDDELARMGLSDITYVLQYSASHGLDENVGTHSAHVFMLLDKELPAPTLKAWLMDINLTLFRDNLRLSRTKSVLSWPLDITTCQNDKLLYIAPPNFIKPLTDPMPKRIEFVKKKQDRLPVARIGEKHINALKTEERKVLNELRKAEGLPARTAKTSWVGTVEVHNKPDICTVTGIKDCGEFVRLNLNGGDSWAYWHPKDNFELVHDFKSDAWYKTKELVPGYYQDLSEQRAALTATPTENGDLILAFRDLKTAEYYNGLWNPQQQRLELYRAKNETQVDHWMRSHGRILGEFIPVWDIQYDPRGDWVVDENEHKINTFVPSSYMRAEPNEKLSAKHFPQIYKIICHMLGEKKNSELVEHFLNWFACIFQRKHKPRTAWVVHGTEGTGKGFFFNKIAAPLLNMKNCSSVTVGNIEDQFNSWLEGKLFVLVDEVDVDDFREKGRVTAKFRSYITEPTMPLRRMRSAVIDVPNYAAFLFSSNQPQPAYIPMSDRRYNVGNYQKDKLPRPDDDIVSKELQAFAEWLLAHKADVTKADEVIHTEARQRIQNLSITSITETCNAILEGNFEQLWLARPNLDLLNAAGVSNSHTQISTAYCMLLEQIVREDFPDKLTRDELLIILQYNVGNIPVTPNKFTSFLRHHNIETKWIRKHDVKTYGIDVEWKVSDELRAELSRTLKRPEKVRRVK